MYFYRNFEIKTILENNIFVFVFFFLMLDLMINHCFKKKKKKFFNFLCVLNKIRNTEESKTKGEIKIKAY